jgi:cytochrome P450
MASATYPPGVQTGTWEAIKFTLAGQEFDPLAFSVEMSNTYGGLSYSRFGWLSFYNVTDAELMQEILVKQVDKYRKVDFINDALSAFLGNGLLTSSGDFWKRQRKLAQPAFHTRRIEAYGDVMVRYTQQMLAGWRNGEQRHLDRDMMKLTLQIVSKTLFDADVAGDADRVGVLLTHILHATNSRVNSMVRLPDWVPTPQRQAAQRDVTELDAIIQRIVDERRESGADRGDLLSMLLLAQDDEGKGMSDQQLRDELMTIFLAGHETTAMNLTWTWYLLSQHPDVVTRLREEVDRVLGDRAATVADLANLPYTEMVVKEAMRLYPPAPAVGREPVEDTELGGYPLPKQALLNLSIFAMHRSARYYPEPDRFDPERFSEANEKTIPKYAYLPFGAGPRVCIGNSFALMEARLVLATMIQQVDLALVPGQQIVPQQLLTVRPRHGLEMTIARREQSVSQPAQSAAVPA